MQVPILKQGNYLIASVQSALSDDDLRRLRDDLSDRVGRFRSSGVIIDVTVLDVIDSFATRTLQSVAQMLKLRGASTVIVGIQPDVAFVMVQLGLTLADVGAALDLEEGLEYLKSRSHRLREHRAADVRVECGSGRAARPLGRPHERRARRSPPPPPSPGQRFSQELRPWPVNRVLPSAIPRK